MFLIVADTGCHLDLIGGGAVSKGDVDVLVNVVGVDDETAKAEGVEGSNSR